MPPWLQAFFQWVRADPSRPLGLGLMTLIVVLWGLTRLYRRLERGVISAISATQAALVQEQVNITNQEIRTAARRIIESARDNRIPIQVVAGSEEEAEGLRQILERRDESEPATEIVDLSYQARRARRRPKVPEDRESVPTAWARILTDDEDVKEAASCLTEIPEKPRRKAKRTR